MAVNAFLTFFDDADGESTLRGRDRWVEVEGWDWSIEAATSWTTGGGATVGKPNPGTLNWEHHFDTSSIVIMGYICTGKAFPKVELQMVHPEQGVRAGAYFTMHMEGVFITKVVNVASDDGDIVQRVEMVFRRVQIDYRAQGKSGKLATATTFAWDIPAGTASPWA